MDHRVLPLREWRRVKGFGLRELARTAGIAVSALQDIESGEHMTPHGKTMRALAGALGVEVVQVAEFAAAPDRWQERRERNVARALDPDPGEGT